MQHAVDTGDGPGAERTVIPPARSQEVAVEVVDVDGRQLLDVEVAEVWLQVDVDDRAGVADGRGCPCRRGCQEPLIQKIGHAPCPEPRSAGGLHELVELGESETLRPMHGLGQPSAPTGVGVGSHVRAQFPRLDAPLPHRSASHDARTVRRSWGSHGQVMGMGERLIH